MEAADRSAAPEQGVVDQPRPADVPAPEEVGPSPETNGVVSDQVETAVAEANPVEPSGEEKAEAAAAEVAKSGYDFEWKLLADDENPLALHAAEMPGTLAWDIAEMQHAVREGDTGPLYGFLLGLLGPEQMAACRKKIAESGMGPEQGAQVFEGLMEAIARAAGTTLGESQASPKS